MIMINARHTVELIEKCIAMKEDRLLRSGNYEPWGFVFLYGALGLLQAHLNLKSAADAKASAIEKLKNLQDRLSQVRQLHSPDDQLDRSISSGSMGPSVRISSLLFSSMKSPPRLPRGSDLRDLSLIRISSHRL